PTRSVERIDVMPTPPAFVGHLDRTVGYPTGSNHGYAPALGGEGVFAYDRPDRIVDLDQGLDAAPNPGELAFVQVLHLAVLYLVPALENAHQLRRSVAALRVEGIDAVIELVPQPGLQQELSRHFQDLVATLHRRLRHLRQALHEVDACARRIQRQEDDCCRLLVDSRQAGNKVDEKALGVCPGIVQPPDEQQDVLQFRSRCGTRRRTACPALLRC